MTLAPTRVGILTFAQMWRDPDTASSRIRGAWLAEYWPDAEIFVMGRQYDAVIFQKAYWPEYASLFPGLKILDICDPDFLHWNSALMEMADLCDGITVPTAALKEFLEGYTSRPIWIIPDRFNFRTVSELKKNHRGNGNTRAAAWFGYSKNYPALHSIAPGLKQLGIDTLIVISEPAKPFALRENLSRQIEVVNYPWELATVNQHLIESDVVLNPQPEFGRWRYKSNNKTVAAWALGLPVAHTLNELTQLSTEEARIQEAELRWRQVREQYDVRLSAAEFQTVIAHLQAAKREPAN